MLPERIFKFGQAELHLQDRRREGFTKAGGLLGNRQYVKSAKTLVEFSKTTYSTRS